MSFESYRYVSFTTYKKDGNPVALPVWIVQLDDGKYAFTTELDSYKVRRVRRNPNSSIRPCSMRGSVDDNAPTLQVNSQVSTDKKVLAEVERKLREKYGIQFVLLQVVDALRRFFTQKPVENCVMVMRVDPSHN